MPGLWKNSENAREGKYLVQRRDGSIPEWPFFVIAASDPAAPQALHAYADAATMYGMDYEYARDIRQMAVEFVQWRRDHPEVVGDPDAAPHRTDDPEIIAKMRHAQGA